MDDQNIAIRLKLLIEDLGITSSQFADECDIARPTLSQLLTGRNKKVSDVLIRQIHVAYPNLSITWLLFGEGEMWNSNDVDDSAKLRNGMTETETTESNPEFQDRMKSDSDKMGSEEKGFSTIGRDDLKYSKETSLNHIESYIHNSINEHFNELLKKEDFLDEIEKLKSTKRKVISITVYYDDSTFETFIPGNI